MITKITPRFPSSNRLLDALSPGDYQNLLPNLERVRLPVGKVLYTAGDPMRHAYFPLAGMISLVSTTSAGDATEVGMVGNEGVVGLPIILKVSKTPHHITVQLPTEAMRIKGETVKVEFDRHARLHDLLLRYTYATLTQLTQSAVCNRFHSVEERLSRWLLTSRDRMRADTLHLTQEFLAEMIGAPRTSVTAVAGRLQKIGVIVYQRGRIQITDSAGLEAASCECYGIINEAFDQPFAA